MARQPLLMRLSTGPNLGLASAPSGPEAWLMGDTTDFIGHIDFAPSLNDTEITYLTLFSQSRRCEAIGTEAKR